MDLKLTPREKLCFSIGMVGFVLQTVAQFTTGHGDTAGYGASLTLILLALGFRWDRAAKENGAQSGPPKS